MWYENAPRLRHDTFYCIHVRLGIGIDMYVSNALVTWCIVLCSAAQ
jgi:hypothetical protein